MSILFAAGPTAASGGLSCRAEDKAVKLTIEGGLTRGMGSPVFDLRGEIEIFDTTIVPDLRRTLFGRAHMAQYWLDGEELRLLLYREREPEKPHGYVEVMVKTKATEEGNYSGVYAVTVVDMSNETGGEGKTLNISGGISCIVE